MSGNESKSLRFQKIVEEYDNRWDEAKQALKVILQEGIEQNDIYLIAASTIWGERGTPHGAMVVGQDAFSWIYRYMVRFSMRYGFHISICMLSMKKADGIEDDAFSEAFYRFEKYLHDNLRKNDMILNGQHNTIFLMLPDLPGQNTKDFIDRVMEEWSSDEAGAALEITSFFQTQ